MGLDTRKCLVTPLESCRNNPLQSKSGIPGTRKRCLKGVTINVMINNERLLIMFVNRIECA